MRDMQCDRRNCHLNNYMCSRAEGAIGMVGVSTRMGVDNLNDPADNNQHDAQRGEKDPPRTL